MSDKLDAPGSSSKSSKKHGHREMAGPYVLGRTLGRGTSGKVKAGYHHETGLDVAVKIIKKDYVRAHKNKIAREIAVMRLIDHPHIMKLYDVFETRQHYYLVLERIRGGELFDYILQKGRLPRKEALRILSQCVKGLEYCHMHSICHRDLKPENLLLDENCNIKIADFGMAQVIPDGEVLGTFCGSPHYGAPEVVSGIKYDGRKSDVWSLGVVFYALVTGMLPFDSRHIPDLLQLVKQGDYTIPKFVEKDIADLIRRMLTKDVNKRIRTHQIKYHPVFYGKNNINLYFPRTPWPSPALEMMKTNPIKDKDDIDRNIVSDLVAFGWGSVEEIEGKLLIKRDTSLHNLEYVFYQLIAARNKQREDEQRKYNVPDEPGSPNPVSFEAPPSPLTPVRVTKSHRSSDAGAGSQPSSPAPRRTNSVKKNGSPSLSSKKGSKKPLSINVERNADAETSENKQYANTTPRFHRLKLTEAESPGAPTTPTAKRSWFKNWFRRRPSIDIVSKEHAQKGASGMYSELKPDEIRKEVESALGAMGISLKIGSTSDYELKCEAFAYIDDANRIVVTDKNGTVKYRDESAEGDEDKPKPIIKTPPHSPKNPDGKVLHHNTSQLIKFTLDISREPSDKVSCINFNHRSGNLVVYRALYTDIIKNMTV